MPLYTPACLKILWERTSSFFLDRCKSCSLFSCRDCQSSRGSGPRIGDWCHLGGQDAFRTSAKISSKDTYWSIHPDVRYPRHKTYVWSMCNLHRSIQLFPQNGQQKKCGSPDAGRSGKALGPWFKSDRSVLLPYLYFCFMLGFTDILISNLPLINMQCKRHLKCKCLLVGSMSLWLQS